MLVPEIVIAAVVALLVVITVMRSVRIVPQQRMDVVERLGVRLGAEAAVVAWVIERQLLKGLRRGSVEPAPRTAARNRSPLLVVWNHNSPASNVLPAVW